MTLGSGAKGMLTLGLIVALGIQTFSVVWDVDRSVKEPSIA